MNRSYWRPHFSQTVISKLLKLFCHGSERVTVMYPGHMGDRCTGLCTQTLVFFFQLYFNKKCVKVVINDFTMHLIMPKWLKRQKCREKRKSVRQEDTKTKEQYVYL